MDVLELGEALQVVHVGSCCVEGLVVLVVVVVVVVRCRVDLENNSSMRADCRVGYYIPPIRGPGNEFANGGAGVCAAWVGIEMVNALALWCLG